MCFLVFLVTLQTRYDPSLFSIISIIFFSVSWKIVLKPFKNIKWRQKIHSMITNWRENVYHGILKLIQHFFLIRLYSQLASFYGNIFSPSCLFWKVLWIWNFIIIKSSNKISKGQWEQIAQAHNKSIIFLVVKRWDVKWQFQYAKHYSCLEEDICCITDFEIFWRVWKK